MSAFWLLIPLLLIRYGVLGLLNKTALKRAAFFPPMAGNEKSAYMIYQISTLFLLIYPFFLKVRTGGTLFFIDIAVYGLGIIVYIASAISFASPEKNGINQNGLYRISRNPMYIGYFIYFLGCVMLTGSVELFVALVIFQISAHWIILSEERWCINEFGESYISYMKHVRRYL